MSDWEDDNDSNNAVLAHYKQDLHPRAESKNRPSSSNHNRHDVRRMERRFDRNNAYRSDNHDYNYDYEDTVHVHRDYIGKIIGKGGSNIQRLQKNYNVRINFNGGVVKVSGYNNSDVQNALRSIKKQMERSDSRYNGSSGRGYSGSTDNVFRDKSSCNSIKENNDCQGSFNNLYSKCDKREISNYTNNDNSDKVGSDGLIDWKSLNEKAELARKLKWSKCPPLTKNFYNEDPEVSKLQIDEVERIRFENNNTTVSRVFKSEKEAADNIPNPVWTFEQCFKDYPDLLAEIYKQDFEKPSPIQAQAWPILLKGEDMIGIAQTGTGKTLAFLLPAMIHTEYQNIPRSQRGGPNVLVMAPTRELALQIEKEVNKYQFRGMKAVCVYGGGSRKEQIKYIKTGVEIIICTPGRLNDLIENKVIDVGTVTYLVLDEADRMLDMGFEPQIRKVLLDIRPDRQTVMCSATWPAGVRRLAQSYMNNPIQVCVGSLDLAATHTVHQVIEILEENDKYITVRNFIRNMKPTDKVIIFCSKKVRADDLSSELTLDRFMCQCIHGSRDQIDREQAIADITSGDVNILIATDVASRGLDIEDITHVINFDFPGNIEDYVHRVGRTGRAGRTGTAISYITGSDWAMASDLIAILEEAHQKVPDALRKMAQRYEKKKQRRRDEIHNFTGGRGPNSVR